MDQPLIFATHFANLVWLLAHRPDDVAEQKAALRNAMAANKDHEVTLATTDLNLLLVSSEVEEVTQWLHELTTRMSGHSARQLQIRRGAAAAELLAVARLIAEEPKRGDEGEAFDAKLLELNPQSVEVRLGQSGFVRVITPPPSPRYPGSRATPMRAMPAVSGRAPAAGSVAIGRVTPDGGSPATGRLTPGGSARLTPPAGMPAQRATITNEVRGIVEQAIVTTHTTVSSEEELLRQLANGVSVQNAMRSLDDLVTLADARALEGKWEVMSRILRAMVQREGEADNAELKRAFTLAIRRMMKPTYLRAIAGFLPRYPEQRDGLIEVLVRAGPEGAEAIIDLLTAADLLTDRRAYLSALVKCRAAVPTLVHLLGDKRWYVVRNAVDLVGEMQATEAESRLIELVKHPEERVRRSVVVSLARIGTPRALQAAQLALGDAVPEVRIQAAAALGQTRNPRAAAPLARALDVESDPEVQATLIAALGRIGTSEAVQRVQRAAEAETRLFKRKPTTVRLAAVQALGEAGTPAALAAVQRLAEDKEREVREAAQRIVAGRSAGSAS